MYQIGYVALGFCCIVKVVAVSRAASDKFHTVKYLTDVSAIETSDKNRKNKIIEKQIN